MLYIVGQLARSGNGVKAGSAWRPVCRRATRFAGRLTARLFRCVLLFKNQSMNRVFLTVLLAAALTGCANDADSGHHGTPPKDPPDYHGVPTDDRPPSMTGDPAELPQAASSATAH